jgi:hypothetical protein
VARGCSSGPHRNRIMWGAGPPSSGATFTAWMSDVHWSPSTLALSAGALVALIAPVTLPDSHIPRCRRSDGQIRFLGNRLPRLQSLHVGPASHWMHVAASVVDCRRSQPMMDPLEFSTPLGSYEAKSATSNPSQTDVSTMYSTSSLLSLLPVQPWP